MTWSIEASGKDEVREFRSALNFLLEKIESALVLNRAVLDATLGPVYLMDKDRRILLANQGTARFTERGGFCSTSSGLGGIGEQPMSPNTSLQGCTE